MMYASMIIVIFHSKTGGGLFIDGFETAVVIVTSEELQRYFAATSS